MPTTLIPAQKSIVRSSKDTFSDQVKNVLRTSHYNNKTEKANLSGIRKLILPIIKKYSEDRHSIATYILESRVDIRTIQELLGHQSLKTTLVYTHIMNKFSGVKSPFDINFNIQGVIRNFLVRILRNERKTNIFKKSIVLTAGMIDRI